jgi:hypothetical protein
MLVHHRFASKLRLVPIYILQGGEKQVHRVRRLPHGHSNQYGFWCDSNTQPSGYKSGWQSDHYTNDFLMGAHFKQEVFQKRLGSHSRCEWRGKCDISLIVGRWRHYLRGQQLATGGPLVDDERGITDDMIFKIDQGHFLGPPCRILECWKRLTRSKLTFMGSAPCTYDENYHANYFFYKL